jgi:hypothetical protein
VVQAVWEAAHEQAPGITEPEVVLPLLQLAGVWDQLFPVERQRIVQLLIERVTLREDGIKIVWRKLVGEMRPGTIGAELLELEREQEAGGITKIVQTGAVRRGTGGKADDFHSDPHPTTVGELLRMTLLSPAVVRAILDDRQPKTLSLFWLQNNELPWAGEDQHAIFAGVDAQDGFALSPGRGDKKPSPGNPHEMDQSTIG